MADFSHQTLPPPAVAPPRPIQNEEDLTHQRSGPLGNMAVVPDNYAGPMPAGAVSESDYRRMVRVYSNISSGKSSLTFDTSNFMKDAEGNDLSLLDDPVGYMEGIAASSASSTWATSKTS